jgi:hypothetical protein
MEDFMSDSDMRKLLDYIIAHRLAPIEEKMADMERTARVPGERIEEINAATVEQEREAAARLLPAFAAGLRTASANRGGPLLLDDRNPSQNGVADALIRFLVKPELATVETEEVGPEHYSYQVTIDWAALERVAQAGEIDLEEALRA